MGKPVRHQREKKKKTAAVDEDDLPELDDAVDAFGRQQDQVGLELSDQEQDDDSLDDEAVYDLDEDEEDEEDLEEDALERGGEIAKLAKTAKALRQKLKLSQGLEDEEEDEEGAKADRLWGASKRAYYDADTAPDDDDEELLQEEEEEALRLERERAAGMRPEDFGLEDEEDEDEDEAEDGEETLEQAARKAQRPSVTPRPGAAGVEVEVVGKSLGALTSEEQLGAIMADAPELLVLIKDLQESLSEVRHRVAPLLKEVAEGGLGTAEGVSYLEAKHMLLLNYCSNIIFYLLLKAEGRPVKDHPVIARLVQLRTFLEKIRPIDKQLAYQIQKILRAASVAQETDGADGAAGAAEDDDATRYGPQPDALLSKASADGGAEGAGGDGVYRPPKLNPVAMEEDASRVNRKEERRLREAKRKASRSEMMRELAQEIVGGPEELRETVAGMDSLAALRSRQRLEARSAVEEDLMMRVQLSKQEAKKLKAQRRAGLSGTGMLEDFAEDVSDLLGMSRGDEAGPSGRQSGLSDLFNKHKVSQKFGADLARQGEKRFKSGDEDAPRREPLHERRAKFDQVAARKAAKASAMDDEAPSKRHREEDDFYQQAKEASQAKKKARSEDRAVPRMAPPLPDEEARGARRITTEIEKNRGMTPHKRRDLKNPRKKHRVKFAKALVRRKGQVQSVKPASAAYGGEASGIKAKLSTSRRMG